MKSVKLKEIESVLPGGAISGDLQRRNRFYFYCVWLLICVLVSFFSGIRLGRTMERERIIEIIKQKKEVAISNEQLIR